MTKPELSVIILNYNTKELYVIGLELEGSKKITIEGDYKEVKSSQKTIAKNVIKKNYLKTGRIRMFKVMEITEMKVRGETLELN